MKKFLFTSESVTEGHPDKICDQISDAILDAIIEQDVEGHVACETAITTGVVFVMGEITSKGNIDIPYIVRKVLRKIGYVGNQWGFDADTCAVQISIDKQSPDIAMGVNNSLEMKVGSYDIADLNGAGDQGMMFGYACNETPEMMPLPISLAHQLSRQLAKVRNEGEINYLGPDGKTQVTVEYDENYRPIKVDTIIVSTQHSEAIEVEKLHKDIKEKVIIPTISEELLTNDTKIYINPTGRFVIGGPQGDSGLTGRKIIVDTYGGFARHGGGAFSGKDPSKVDRSAAYMARYIAKNIVAAGIAERCEVQIAYAIGVAAPVSLMVETFGTGKYHDSDIAEAVNSIFDLRPKMIISKFNLQKPIYQQLAVYGHMGREDLEVEWEVTDKINELKEYFRDKSTGIGEENVE